MLGPFFDRSLGALVVLGLGTSACFNPEPPAETDSTTGSTSTPDPSTGPALTTTDAPTTTADDTTSTDGSSSTPDPDTTTGAQGDTIYEVQDGTLATGAAVDLRGVVVTAVEAEGVFVQEPAGGMYSGVFVFLGVAPTVVRGDEVDVVGSIVEVMNQTVIDASVGSVEATGVMGVEPMPELLTVGALAPDAAEPWEGVLVRVEGAPLQVSAVPAFGFTVTEGADALDVGEGLYDLQADPKAFPGFGISASFTAIQGPFTQVIPGYRVLPRDADDLEGYVPAFVPETHPFPIAGDTTNLGPGVHPWNAGDFYAGVRMTMLSSLSSVDVHIDVVDNGLSDCGFQNAEVILNGVLVGDFTLEQGTVVVDESYPVPMGVVGPDYTVRYETTMTVESGCGAAGYSQATSTITFNP